MPKRKRQSIAERRARNKIFKTTKFEASAKQNLQKRPNTEARKNARQNENIRERDIQQNQGNMRRTRSKACYRSDEQVVNTRQRAKARQLDSKKERDNKIQAESRRKSRKCSNPN
ncbi:unnamed protein product [Allacma fusca]|uniref:Uncharacterized protein n=1 Tax=Allacma fusca TaxID=39272 RepID=A0A8J2KS87_9HEXA|nr:unnamed protein product [Allacma fusca]